MKKTLANLSKLIIILTLAGKGVTSSRNFIENILFPQNDSTLENIAHPIIKKNTGVIKACNNTLEYISHELYLTRYSKQAKKRKNRNKDLKIRFSKSNIYSVIGSGSCAEIDGRKYILTNEHITKVLSQDLAGKILSDEKLDLSIVPLNLFTKFEGNLNCSNISQNSSKIVEFQGFGRRMYYAKAQVETPYRYVIGFKVRDDTTNKVLYLRETTKGFRNTYFMNNFPGISGSNLFSNSGEIAGVIHSVNSFASKSPFYLDEIPMKYTGVLFTPSSEINKFLNTKQAYVFFKKQV